MANKLAPPRRWYGLLCLVLGGAMLFWGQTVLSSRLTGKTFIIYWTLCFLVTGLALIISLWDSYRLRRQMRQKQQRLLQEMLQQVEQARRERAGDAETSPPHSPNR
jgi:membrane protein implicated in regulation of membrane protease activity